MRKFKDFSLKLLIIFFLLIIFIFISAKTYSQTMFKNISNEFLRLHVVANSDSTEDQILKYEIRDAVLEFIKPYFSEVNSKDEAICVLNDKLDEIYTIAYNVLYDNGYDYSVNISVGNFYFPTKEYSNITLPEGNYDALKIELGKAEGQNWWCVMFPSLCLIDTNDYEFSNSSDEILKNNLSSEEYSIISDENNSPDLKIKFKLIELFENI